MEALKSKLRNLKLAGAVKSLEIRNKFALENKLSYIEFLEMLIEDEHANRLSNSYKKRFSKSKLNVNKTIDEYDFKYQPEMDKKLINRIPLNFFNSVNNIT